MENISHRIQRCNDHEREIFRARQLPFSENLSRWCSDERPGQQNNNYFFPVGTVTVEELRAAIALQQARGLNYLMIRSNQPLSGSLVKEFGLEEEKTYVMALLQDVSEAWPENSYVEIKDIQTHDITADILDVSEVPEQYRDQALQNMEMVLEVAGSHPEYHWLCGYVEGKKAGNVYALCHDGCVEMDDLWVDEEFRNRYIATTLMKHLAQTLPGTLYLHAEADKTPKDMYAKMGFEIVGTNYDYYLEW